MAIMPMRQKQTRYGSSSRLWSAATANGKHARAVPAIIMAPTPRWRTAIAARTAFSPVTRTVTRRAPAMASRRADDAPEGGDWGHEQRDAGRVQQHEVPVREHTIHEV